MIVQGIAGFAFIFTAASLNEVVLNDKQQDQVRSACMADIVRLCPREFSTGDRYGVRSCLRANLAKTSRTCQASVRAITPERNPPKEPKRQTAPTRGAVEASAPKS